MTLVIRAAVVDDLGSILGLIRELADYEKLGHQVVATEELLRVELFGARPIAEALIAEWGGAPAGFALFFHNFSTFLGKKGLYLEDLFVKPELRAKGIGRELFRRLAQIACERHCGRFEWSVLDWNAPAIEFYRKLGAEPMDEWTVFRLDEAAIIRVAEGVAK